MVSPSQVPDDARIIGESRVLDKGSTILLLRRRFLATIPNKQLESPLYQIAFWHTILYRVPMRWSYPKNYTPERGLVLALMHNHTK
jgi:hypothetical protein